jgi:Fe-S-cluster containining protein
MTSRPSKAASNGTRDLTSLRNRLSKARAKGAGKFQTDRARRLLDSYLATAEQHGRDARDVIVNMASGEAASAIGLATREALMADPPDVVRHAACAEGCAFCCILSGGNGGTITEAEAKRLHEALTPFAGQPDGRDWHRDACPALDPITRACRVYAARPMICRSFLSIDADACETNANGGEVAGAGLIGTHLDYLAVHALAREALKGVARVATYSLARVAAAAVAGENLEASLGTGRHATQVLEVTCRDAAKAGAGRRSGA